MTEATVPTTYVKDQLSKLESVLIDPERAFIRYFNDCLDPHRLPEITAKGFRSRYQDSLGDVWMGSGYRTGNAVPQVLKQQGLKFITAMGDNLESVAKQACSQDVWKEVRDLLRQSP